MKSHILLLLILSLGVSSLRAQNDAHASLDLWKGNQPPFSFKYDGRISTGFLPSWQRTEMTITVPNKYSLHKYSFTDPDTKLEVTADVRTFTDFDAVEWILHFTNKGDKDTPILEDIKPLNWTITPTSDTCILHHARGSDAKVNDFEPLTETFGPGKTITIGSKNGRSSDTDTLPFFNLQMGDKGMVGAIGWTGNWQAHFNFDGTTKRLTTIAGMTQTHFLLHPGETVRTPRILLMNWSGGDWQAAQNSWRRLLLAHYSPCTSLNGPVVTVPFCLGTWGAEPIAAKLDWVQQLHDHKIPFDVYWIDAGWYGSETPKGAGPDMDVAWYRYRGTWVPNATTYPNGFKPLGDALKAANIGFLLWFEAETADPGSALLTQHPDWFLQMPQPPGKVGTGLLNLGLPAARKGITDIVSNMITEAGLTWYRQDFNIPSYGYWEFADPPDRVGITEINDITGLYQFWDDLRAQHPGLQIDNCSSGGRRLDLETMSRSVSLWRTDYECGFFDPIGGQLETQGLAPWVPLNAGCYGGVAPGTPNDGASFIYAMRSNYSAGLVLNPGDRGAPGDIPLDLMKKVGDEFQELHPYFTGDFYALQSYDSGTKAWAVWQFDRPDLKAGMVMLFRRQDSDSTSMQPALQALDPKAQYQVEIRTGFEKAPVKIMSGQDLAKIQVTLPDKPSSALIFYHQN